MRSDAVSVVGKSNVMALSANSRRELVRLYESWNKPDEAEKWRAKLPETQRLEE